MCKENPYVSYIPKIHKEFIAVSPSSSNRKENGGEDD
jgi:hypothetical protein